MSDSSLKIFHEIVNKAIAKAVAKGIHNSERVLLLLTETDPFSRYGYDEINISEPHTTDGRLILPFGKNEKGQRQFLISFDPSSCDDKSHPDPGVPAGWDWETFDINSESKPELEQKETNPIILVLTRKKQEDKTEKIEPEKQGEIQGFTLARMPDIGNHEQFVIMVDPTVFTVQIQSN